MRLIKKIDLTTKQYVDVEKRDAARGITIDNKKVLLIYIEKDETYIFPGGGVEFGESFEEACIREMKEEAGAQGVKILSEFGYIDEYRDSKRYSDLAFNMISYYYLCEISDLNGKINLEAYEKDLGFQAIWIDVSKALQHNRKINDSINFTSKKRRYLDRSIVILEELERRLLDGKSGN